MELYEVRVTPEVARTRENAAGTRNVSVVLTFARQPILFVGEPPQEIREDTGLEVRRLKPAAVREALQKGRVTAHACPADLLSRTISAGLSGAPGGLDATAADLSLVERVAALEAALAAVIETDPISDVEGIRERLDEMKRAELDELHERLLNKKPHGNAGDESVRDAIREALDLDE